ncbi:SRPBCC domain-containing protein [bacterium]|nr:SRPBCC domain-containing protein [bacterium]
MSITIQHSIEIAASPRRIWQVLTDLDSFPAWSGFKGTLSCRRLARGARITVAARPRPGKVMLTWYTVTEYEPEHRLGWRALYLPFGLLSGNRVFAIKRLAAERSLVTTAECYSGWGLVLFRRKLATDGPAGYIKLLDSLKHYCESA